MQPVTNLAGWPACERCQLPLNVGEPHERAYGGVLHVGCCRIWDLAARGDPLSPDKDPSAL